MENKESAFMKYMANAKKKEEKEKEKQTKDLEKIENKIFEYKIQKLNNILRSEGITFNFDIRKKENYYEFDIPLQILIGTKTRKFCADLWSKIMDKADISMDFTDEIDRIIKEMKGIVVTMKLNKKMTKEIGQGEIKQN